MKLSCGGRGLVSGGSTTAGAGAAPTVNPGLGTFTAGVTAGSTTAGGVTTGAGTFGRSVDSKGSEGGTLPGFVIWKVAVTTPSGFGLLDPAFGLVGAAGLVSVRTTTGAAACCAGGSPCCNRLMS